ncbi:hypothetical protein N7481_007773 [Penicillium waksmanii]|uniref:uncharacterized protein n=1 Tax=Penicillium waksmanii TaxID=69791 RepID=UPI0025488E63|nr:uncharacterized protein N7481_007773 [Penicillium waksmanii]KAJ5980475.1 hypothetical protein N7481_007773 [Penicillium waksmanii]
MSWKEMNLLSKLPPHPNIIRVDRIVLEDIDSRVIGFTTKQVILFDFDWAANGKDGLLDNRDDMSGVAFTLYEIITNDTHVTSIPRWERNIDMVQNIEWSRRELDSDVSKFRKFLNE